MWKRSEKTKEPENNAKAYEYAVFLLSLKLRTIGEVVKKMQQRGYTEGVIEKTIDQLKAQRYLDDQRYAEVFLENLKAYKNFGFFGIKKKFMDKKIPLPIIEKVLEDYLSLEDEIKIGQRLLKKEGYAVKPKNIDLGEVTYNTYQGEEKQQAKNKMANRLKTRGFRGEVISRLLF